MRKLPRMQLGMALLIALSFVTAVVLLAALFLLKGTALPTVLATHALFNAVLVTLGAATLLAIADNSARRSSWVGFALFSWIYVILGIYLYSDGLLPSQYRVDSTLLPDLALSILGMPTSEAGRCARTIAQAMVTLIAGIAGYIIAFRFVTMGEDADRSTDDRAHDLPGAEAATLAGDVPAADTKPKGIPVIGLMCLAALVAVGLCAFQSPTDLWSSSLLTVTIAALSTATLFAIVSHSPNRVCWAGAAAFGWMYLGLSVYLPRGARGELINIYSDLIPASILSGLVGRRFEAAYSRIIAHCMATVLVASLGYLAAYQVSNRKTAR